VPTQSSFANLGQQSRVADYAHSGRCAHVARGHPEGRALPRSTVSLGVFTLQGFGPSVALADRPPNKLGIRNLALHPTLRALLAPRSGAGERGTSKNLADRISSSCGERLDCDSVDREH
jgi:hypothetical protein